jgi:predicted alpha/beta-fold hydrolase
MRGPAYGGVEVNKLSPLYHPEKVGAKISRKPERRLYSVTTGGGWLALVADIGRYADPAAQNSRKWVCKSIPKFVSHWGWVAPAVVVVV